jgi:hypothetical protein
MLRSIVTNEMTGSEKASKLAIKITNGNDLSQKPFVKTKEEVMFKGWRTVVRKNVTNPSGKTVSFDITSQGNPSVVVFNWCSKTNTTTLIQEYHPGIEKVMFGTVAGNINTLSSFSVFYQQLLLLGVYEVDKKHSSALEAAQFELEEEAHLKTSNEKWFPLLEDETYSTSVEKYSDNRLYMYLALDCDEVTNPKPMDDEEFITIHRGVTYKELMHLLNTGQLNLPSSFTVLMGLRKLQELGYVLE